MNSDTNAPSFNRARDTWPWAWLVLAAVLWVGTCLWALNYAGFFLNAPRSVSSEPGEDRLLQDAEVDTPAPESIGAVDEGNSQAGPVTEPGAERAMAEREAAEEAARAEAEREAAEEAERAEAEREAAEEAARAEAEREAAEEAARAEAERKAAEEAARAEAEREAAEEAARAEAERVAAQVALQQQVRAEEEARTIAAQEAARVAALVAAQAENASRSIAPEVSSAGQDSADLLESAKALEEVQRQAEEQAAEVQRQAEADAREALEAERLEAFREQRQIDAQARQSAAEEAARVAAVAERLRNYELLRARELRTLSVLSTQVQFLSQSSTVTRELERPLDRMFDPLYLYSEVPVVVSVASNEGGPAASNNALSEDRAQSIVDYLVSRGLEEQRFRIQAEAGSGLRLGTHRVRVFVLEDDQ